MAWDIVLAVIAFAAQFLTAYVGWRVTVDGVRPERKGAYEALFLLGGLVGAVAIALSAYRAGEVSQTLADLRKGQQTTNEGLQQLKNSPPVVNVNTPAPQRLL